MLAYPHTPFDSAQDRPFDQAQESLEDMLQRLGFTRQRFFTTPPCCQSASVPSTVIPHGASSSGKGVKCTHNPQERAHSSAA